MIQDSPLPDTPPSFDSNMSESEFFPEPNDNLNPKPTSAARSKNNSNSNADADTQPWASRLYTNLSDNLPSWSSVCSTAKTVAPAIVAFGAGYMLRDRLGDETCTLRRWGAAALATTTVTAAFKVGMCGGIIQGVAGSEAASRLVTDVQSKVSRCRDVFASKSGDGDGRRATGSLLKF